MCEERKILPKPKTAYVDWEKTETDVIRAKNGYLPGKRYVNLRHLSEFIFQNRNDYPSFADATFNQIKYRVEKATAHLGWEDFTSHGCRNTVRIDPAVV